MSTHGACNVPPIHLIALTTIPVLSPVIFMPSLYYTPYNSFNYTDADRSRCGVAVCNYALSAFERPPLPTRSSQLSHGRHSGQVSNGLRSSSEGLIPFSPDNAQLCTVTYPTVRTMHAGGILHTHHVLVKNVCSNVCEYHEVEKHCVKLEEFVDMSEEEIFDEIW